MALTPDLIIDDEIRYLITKYAALQGNVPLFTILKDRGLLDEDTRTAVILASMALLSLASIAFHI